MARRRIGPWYRLAVIVLRPLMTALTRRNWQGAENLPVGVGFVVVVNHISHLDPFTFGHFMYDNGYLPRFLTKEAVFRTPFIGRVVSGAQQIPVYRETADAAASFSAAVDAVRRGECVAIYPEGTLTRDPDLWPMRGKTGAARIALATGAPVIPVGQWGAQEILPPYSKRPHVFPRKKVRVLVGDPVRLDDLRARGTTAATIREATDRIMHAITALVEELRGRTAPVERFDPRKAGVQEFGNPNKPTKDEE